MDVARPKTWCRRRAWPALAWLGVSLAPVTDSLGEPFSYSTAPNQVAVTATAESSESARGWSGPDSAEPLPPPGLDVLASQTGLDWWQPMLTHPLTSSGSPLQVTLEDLITGALRHSASLRVATDAPLIRDTIVIEAQAEFDWTAFVATKWNDISEPVGNTLTTGGPNRFNDHRLDHAAGARRKVYSGGRFEVAQRYGWQRNNSVFLVPNDQATSRLTLSFTQPLLRGAGRMVNTSLIAVAELDAGVARQQLLGALQDHLLQVTEAYWNLYRERGAYLQRLALYHRAAEILQELERRQDLDTLANQIVRARAAVAARKSELARREAEIKNAEGVLRVLTNDPALGAVGDFELLPLDAPTFHEQPLDMLASIEIGLRHRPEMSEAMGRIKAGAVRQQVASNELLPALDLIMETYVAGLRGNSNFANSWSDQFTEGAPSYALGMQLEVPICNRAARARYERRRLEIRQLQNELLDAMQQIRVEVEIAIRESETSYREVAAKRQAVQAAASEVEFIQARWQQLPDTDRAAGLVLEDLLAAQSRMSDEELGYLAAQVNYSMAWINIKRVTGTLLQYENVHQTRAVTDCLPTIVLDKSPGIDQNGQSSSAE